MTVTGALSDQYPAHNIQIFSHRFSSEFCISFKHKLITSALPVHSFLFAPLLQCCGILLKLLTMEQSFRDWNETLHMISFLTTFTSLLASPAPLIPSSPGEECATQLTVASSAGRTRHLMNYSSLAAQTFLHLNSSSSIVVTHSIL